MPIPAFPKNAIKSIQSLLLPMEEDISEGEEYIRDFLEEWNIKYEREKEVLGLVGDTKSYRRADFYLPKYDLYIEFLGQWNSGGEHRERYKEKMRSYYRNGLACVYIFPENLGILDHSFKRRARQVLHHFGRRRQLLRFNLKWFWLDQRRDILISLVPLFLAITSETKFDQLVYAGFHIALLLSIWSSGRYNFSKPFTSREQRL